MKFSVSFLFIFLSSCLLGQSISGNVSTKLDKSVVQFGNVDVFKGDKKVASVLTDRLGNFKVKLDTGMYKCVIQFAGLEPIVQNIHVKGDEKSDFSMSGKPKTVSKSESVELEEVSTIRLSLKKDVKSMEGKHSSIGKGSYGAPPTETILSDEMATSLDKKSEGGYGVLTAGEINDFSKWMLWQGEQMDQLRAYQSTWHLAPEGRYTLQLQNDNRFPIANATVRLLGNKNDVFYQTKTDNTGKAECWVNINNRFQYRSESFKMEVIYNGKTYTVRDVKPFEQKINQYRIPVSCSNSDEVDIAFVVDATGSMSDEMNYLTAELNEIVYASKSNYPNLSFRFANVFYRDHGDEYLTRMQQFQSVLSESVYFIGSQFAGGGGDTPEAVEVALDSAVHRLNWNVNARTRILFLVLDAPPHGTDSIANNLMKTIKDAAELGIRIVPIAASGVDQSLEYLLRSMALATNGSYVFLTNDSGVGGDHIKPTTDNFNVERLKDLMVRLMKNMVYMPNCDRTTEDENQQVDSVMRVQSDTTNKPSDTRILNWKYYPNPTNGKIVVVANKDIDELLVADITGKCVLRENKLKSNEPRIIDLSQFPTGMYVLRFEDEGKWHSGKVILVHGIEGGMERSPKR